ncbi:hypothetical protein THMIRHAS_18240 [Thiosulfatimonas sediminis]|uniref:Aminoglycoside phosphotransferase domain-containing protein n=1 Tax=Thiosulfatimonas sediminis TaxID=2675054 RepID=A0A6F8PWE7_9GAMM|nr:phosphotransferase [Thiosulfatimonas sediminis]BBP46451.1 hypothetical protein THMIRHAS_18240 [Thiosulfatimonas sediminis]
MAVYGNSIDLLRGLLGKPCNALLEAYDDAQLYGVKFSDSTHQIWRLEGVNQAAVLKLADLPRLRQQPFWQGAQTLFAWDLSADYSRLAGTYRFFAERAMLSVPNLLACCVADKGGKAVLLTDFVEGQTLDVQSVCAADCQQLARYLVAMHQLEQQGIGGLGASNCLSLSEFQQRIVQFLHQSERLQSMETDEKAELVDCGLSVKPLSLVPMVLDLRWDQFVRNPEGNLVLLDLDAALSAPLEMDWLMLEVILTASQIKIVILEYKQRVSMPSRADLQQVRMLYRALFCGIGLLGDQDWNWWRSLPPILDEIID